jgi:hypothetical protein
MFLNPSYNYLHTDKSCVDVPQLGAGKFGFSAAMRTMNQEVFVAEWIYDQVGLAGAILDDYSIRNRDGNVVAWVFGIGVFALPGEHIGWFEDGVLYDSDNCVLGFIDAAKGRKVVTPLVVSTPALPPFARRPSTPRLHGKPGRLEPGPWSGRSLQDYFTPAVTQAAVPQSRAMATRLSVRLLRYRQRAAVQLAGR